ncbi:MAG TPA: dihydrodipicolinate synthase family protein [Acidimicrobiales bacterium]|nr:dihydrodipicolinate synthase family protein [Acidimicrobiales bacterium]
MAPGPIFNGVGAALVTLFREDGDLDAGATAELACRLVECGIAAVVVAGTTGEAFALDPAERAELIGTVKSALASTGVPVIAGTGAPTGRQAARLTAQARQAGADGVLTLSPAGAGDPRPYYEMVSIAADGLPLLAYHYPKVSTPGISLEVLADLPVDGIKDSSGDAARLLATLDSWDKPVYPGASSLTFLASQLGCPGMILALANAEPETCIAAWRGDAGAQLKLAKSRNAEAAGARGIKKLVAARFGSPATCRVA